MIDFRLIIVDVNPLVSLINNNINYKDVNQSKDDDSEDEEEQYTSL